MSDTQIRTELVLEENLGEQLGDVADGFEQASKAEVEAQRGLVEMARSFRDVFEAGRYASELFDKLADGLTEAASAGQVADHSLALMTASVQKIPWQEALEGAQKLGDGLDELAQRAGVAGEQVEAGFHALVELHGASTEGIALARAQIDALSTVGGTMGKNVEGMAREIGFMGEGMLKTKGQMFQLLQGVGAFGADTKKAKEEWASLTEESRIARLNEGVELLAAKAAEMPHSFEQSKTSLKDVVEMLKEKAGEPIIEALQPILVDLKDFIHDSMPTMVSAAKAVASVLGPLFSHIREVVAFWVANKVVVGAMGAASAVGGLGAAATAGGGVLASLGGAISNLASPVNVATLGLGLFGLAVSEVLSALDDEKPSLEAYGELQKKLGKASHGSYEQIMKETTALLAEANSKEMLTKLRVQEKAAIDDEILAVRSAAYAREQSAKSAREEEGRLKYEREHRLENKADVYRMFKEIAGSKSGDQGRLGLMHEAADAWLGLWNEAQKKYEQALDEFNKTQDPSASRAANELLQEIVSQLAGLIDVQRIIEHSSAPVAGGLGAIGRILDILDNTGKLGNFDPGFLRRAHGLGSKFTPQASVFGGPTTITIKQEFREQDPDRIALVFRRDLMRAAERRYSAQSSFGTSGT